MNYTEEMAGFMAGLALEDIPDHIRRLARVNMMDAVGVIIGGHAFLEHEEDGRLGRYLDLLPQADQATALGFHRRSSLQAAGFANGTLSEVLDWQDTTMSARVHSGSGTVPAVLAAAEWRHSTGEEMVRAMAVGYEVGARVGVAIQPSHWHEGFQATGTIGAIGAAAAVGSLLGFGPSQMANVLGVAGYILAISNGDGVFHGYTIKPVHGGMAAQAGIQAALLVESGYEAGPLEGLEPRKHGFMNIASEDVRPERLTEGLGSTWESSACSQKLYPVGLLIVGPVQVALDLVNRHQISAAQVESVLVTSYSGNPAFRRQTLHDDQKHVRGRPSVAALCGGRGHSGRGVWLASAEQRADSRSGSPRPGVEGNRRRGRVDGRDLSGRLAGAGGDHAERRPEGVRQARQGHGMPEQADDRHRSCAGSSWGTSRALSDRTGPRLRGTPSWGWSLWKVRLSWLGCWYRRPREVDTGRRQHDGQGPHRAGRV